MRDRALATRVRISKSKMADQRKNTERRTETLQANKGDVSVTWIGRVK